MLKNNCAALKKANDWDFYHFWFMTMTKGVYDPGLTLIRGLAQGQNFYRKSFLIFES